MIKMEIGRCCLHCDFEDIEVQRYGSAVKTIDGLKRVQHVTHVGCSHRAVCADYLREPLQALPVEQLFGPED